MLEPAPQSASSRAEPYGYLHTCLAGGRPICDEEFDRIYPEPLRRISAEFWTPVRVARRAAELLVEGVSQGRRQSLRVLDVGAGVGKLCAIGAITTGAAFTGVEHREALVASGRRALDGLGVRGARLVHGTLR